jgi:hypothetical protein
MRITLSRHAGRRIAERNIPKAWIELAIEAPDWETPDSTDPRLMRAYKRFPQASGHVLRVVYLRKDNNEVLVITAFPDRDAVPPDA